MNHRNAPQAAGLYDPAYEHDACGVALVARLDGTASHECVARALTALENLEHRGAAGADARTGDGAGILIQMPDRLFRGVLDVELPRAGAYGVGVIFLPQDEGRRAELEQLLEHTVAAEGQRVIAWRDVPVDLAHVGDTAGSVMPVIRQLFVGAEGPQATDQDAFERKLYVIRRVAELAAGPELVIPSFSSRTVVYKGMLISHQLKGFYPDLSDDRAESALGLVHSRFSTNTFPSWELAHPYRMIAHNGEINTLRGNVNWMRARESQLSSELFGEDLSKVLPVVRPSGSDSATFDNVLELLVLAGRELPHAVMMMIPEAYTKRSDLPEDLVGFYAFHSCLMEPWDGPAAVAFTDGRVIGATLDRNGLRPGRWTETTDGWVVLASETGVLPDEPDEIIKRKGRLQPGKLFLVDLEQGRIVEDREVKQKVASRKPYGQWFDERVVHLEDLPDREPAAPRTEPLRARQLAFGYTQEDLKVLLAPMARNGEEPIGSMGNDTALPVMSDLPVPLFSYFKQLFAQVTNPPIDPIREEIVMSIGTGVGAEGNLLSETPEHAHQLIMAQPILRAHEVEKLRQVHHGVFNARTIDITWLLAEGPEGLSAAVDRICAEAHDAIADGVTILILSDRNTDADRAPIPSLLAVASVHHHLVREGTRLQAGLVLESGEPREVHHFATLIGYGASAIAPYVMLETVGQLVEEGRLPDELTVDEAEDHVVKAIGKGLRKTISKMGISTIQSYCGAQIFEAVGLEPALIDRHFTGTASRIGGIGLDVLAAEALERHVRGYPQRVEDLLPVGGIYAWRREGERHMWNPETVAALQHAVRLESQDAYDDFARMANEEATRRSAIRGLLKFRDDVEPIPLDEVQEAKELVRRFVTGAMSLGSISTEAHETLAIAMNRLGGKSNTGEGGEDPRRFTPDPNGDLRRSAIKQVASGRFGVTINYLVNADELQIKMAQGAKPGEGGQLPGHKVDRYIGQIRHSTPGVGLISPPPHHDIYSIEDLKQLIYDLRCANKDARISVKLVSEVGVGTVAAGVAKANADHVLISGDGGGTGASPLSSIQAAGVPWEIGLAETQQTLLLNDLRSRIWVQTDGQLKTGRDVVVAACLGADEFGFSTAPLIATGCIMMRACHLNTCPVGIATQDPELRKKFRGTPEHVVNYFFFVAEEARKVMASLGVRTLDELIGRTDLLVADEAIEHWKARGIDLTHVLTMPELPPDTPRRRVKAQEPVLDDALDWQLIDAARPVMAGEHERVELDVPVFNVNRCVGGLLSAEITRRNGAGGLADDAVAVTFRGSAGQSFGGWLAPGVSFHLYGDANDYCGKGLSGGVLAVQPPEAARFVAEENVLIGNTSLYGATSGRAFFRGLAGERFAVRNSGALAVVEGVGDHGCEYMTGGRVVVLGRTGRNFAAGMSGGIAYVLDEDGTFAERCNLGMVGFDEISEWDATELRGLVEEHAQRTGSRVARRVLDAWADTLPLFVKVMPHDYKRVLAELAAEGDGVVDHDGHEMSTSGEGFVITETEELETR
jgi:glutamate synthase domain-containing protein 2/glutamate synthase domain-containing protein 1/glutamate synthase domain-containing protein 3